MQNFDDLDDMLFGGSVIGKLIDILGNANKNLVEIELERFLARVAAMESILEEKGVNDTQIKSFIFENQDVLKRDADSIALTLTADILTQNE